MNRHVQRFADYSPIEREAVIQKHMARLVWELIAAIRKQFYEAISSDTFTSLTVQTVTVSACSSDLL